MVIFTKPRIEEGDRPVALPSLHERSWWHTQSGAMVRARILARRTAANHEQCWSPSGECRNICIDGKSARSPPEQARQPANSPHRHAVPDQNGQYAGNRRPAYSGI
jgi:hypothetical protein